MPPLLRCAQHCWEHEEKTFPESARPKIGFWSLFRKLKGPRLLFVAGDDIYPLEYTVRNWDLGKSQAVDLLTRVQAQKRVRTLPVWPLSESYATNCSGYTSDVPRPFRSETLRAQRLTHVQCTTSTLKLRRFVAEYAALRQKARRLQFPLQDKSHFRTVTFLLP